MTNEWSVCDHRGHTLGTNNQILGTRVLTEQVEVQGYPTKSKNFLAIDRLVLSRMDNTENIPDKGYRLKKR